MLGRWGTLCFEPKTLACTSYFFPLNRKPEWFGDQRKNVRKKRQRMKVLFLSNRTYSSIFLFPSFVVRLLDQFFLPLVLHLLLSFWGSHTLQCTAETFSKTSSPGWMRRRKTKRISYKRVRDGIDVAVILCHSHVKHVRSFFSYREETPRNEGHWRILWKEHRQERENKEWLSSPRMFFLCVLMISCVSDSSGRRERGMEWRCTFISFPYSKTFIV